MAGSPRDEKESFEHRFFVDGHEETFTIPADGAKFELQNKLQEGYIYDITISGYTVTGAEDGRGRCGRCPDQSVDR